MNSMSESSLSLAGCPKQVCYQKVICHQKYQWKNKRKKLGRKKKSKGIRLQNVSKIKPSESFSSAKH